MKCRTCKRADYAEHTGVLNVERPGLGTFPVPAVDWEECPHCGCRLLPLATLAAIDAAADRLRTDILMRQPVSAFIPEKEAARLLGVTKAAIQKSRKARNLIYSIDRFGHREFHRRSVIAFKKTGDGRFSLVQAEASAASRLADPISPAAETMHIIKPLPRIPITDTQEYAHAGT